MNQQANTFLTQASSYSSQIPTYKVPRQYVDCRQLLNIKLYGPTGSQKPQLKTQQKLKLNNKKFYLDEKIQPFKNIPAPNKYLENYSTHKRYKSQNTFITSPSKNEKNLGKRPTWVEDIERFQKKFKPPAAGKYNLLTKSDFSIPKKSLSLQKLLKNGVKFNNFDDSIYVSAQIPGPGAHNPEKIISKLKVNMMTTNMWKKKHHEDEKRIQKRLNSSSTSSFSYSPMKDRTFDSIGKKEKKDSTLMKIVTIDKRKGFLSKIKSPGPGSHDTVNRWASQTFQKQKLIGNLNLFSKTTRSLPSLKVYH